MNEAKLYYVSETGLVEGEALGRLRVYLAADYDALRAENAELVAALVDAQKIINHQGWSTNEQPAYDAIDAALAKHRGE